MCAKVGIIDRKDEFQEGSEQLVPKDTGEPPKGDERTKEPKSEELGEEEK